MNAFHRIENKWLYLRINGLFIRAVEARVAPAVAFQIILKAFAPFGFALFETSTVAPNKPLSTGCTLTVYGFPHGQRSVSVHV